MNKFVAIHPITVGLDPDTWERLERAAIAEDVSMEVFAADAIRAAAEEWSAEFEAFIASGERAIAEGRFHTQEEMDVWFDQRIAAARSRMETPESSV